LEESGRDEVSVVPVSDDRSKRFWRAVVSLIVLDLALCCVLGGVAYQDALNDVVVGGCDGDIVLFCRQTSGWTPNDGPFRGSTIVGFQFSWSGSGANEAAYFYFSIPLWFVMLVAAIAPLRWWWNERSYLRWRRSNPRGFDVVVSPTIPPPPTSHTAKSKFSAPPD
jgi:hypothetical protein